LVIVAGSPGYHGAAVLAARGAMAAHPGLITVVTPRESYLPIAAQMQSVMVRSWESEWVPPARSTAVVFGPGLADSALSPVLRGQMVKIWEEFEGAVVVDASGLDWLELRNREWPGPRVITPHPGEAARLLNIDTQAVQADRVAGLRRLTGELAGVVVVLKGYQTLVGQGGGRVYVNSTGGPMLGQGGSGDVLAGFAGGLLAQPALHSDPLNTMRYAVWRHGLAGESPQWNGLIDDLPAELAGPWDPAATRNHSASGHSG